jgi:hypothetical protein
VLQVDLVSYRDAEAGPPGQQTLLGKEVRP